MRLADGDRERDRETERPLGAEPDLDRDRDRDLERLQKERNLWVNIRQVTVYIHGCSESVYAVKTEGIYQKMFNTLHIPTIDCVDQI